jgi:hypothetical protein
MSIETTSKQYPVVLRFEGMFPDQLDGYEGHRQRVRGDDGNIVRERSHLNKLLIGDADWAERVRAEVEEMRTENFAAELEELKRRKRKKEGRNRLAEGPKDPWRKTRHGPMRELILTANSEWFEQMEEDALADAGAADQPQAADESPLRRRERAFEELAVSWLKDQFGDDVIHARADRDEIAYHIHAVILPRETKSVNGATRRMLQPSKFAIIEDYEKAQDSVGEWFAKAGLIRGERRAEAVRKARDAGETPPPKPRHTRPHAWRKAEEARLALLENAVAARTAQAERVTDELERRTTAVAEQQRAAATERRTLSEQRDALAQKEAEVAKREKEAAEKSKDALAAIKLAEHLANGMIEIDEAPNGAVRARPTAEQPPTIIVNVLDQARRGGLASRALDAFARLRARLKKDADEALAARERQVEQDAAAVLAVDDHIVEVAQHLPENERAVIARLRAGLAAPLTRLKRLARWRDGASRSGLGRE